MSVGVTIEPDGRVRWGCSHCSWQGPQKGARAKANGADQPELPTYEYRDASGVMRFRKVRRKLPGGEKTFWLEQPDGRGGWVKNTKGVDTKILYRVDEVAKAIAEGRSIAIVEGEKDCDALWRLGFPATCNAHGASEVGKAPKWYAQHSGQLKEADIIVAQRMTRSERLHAHADATCKLSLGIAKRVRRLILKEHLGRISRRAATCSRLARPRSHSRGAASARRRRAGLRAGHVSQARQEAASGDEATDNNGELDEADETEIERLANLPLIAYDRERKAAAQKLRLRASLLDKVVTAKRAELGLVGLVDDGLPGRPLTFETIEVWDDPVDGAEIADRAFRGDRQIHRHEQASMRWRRAVGGARPRS